MRGGEGEEEVSEEREGGVEHDEYRSGAVSVGEVGCEDYGEEGDEVGRGGEGLGLEAGIAHAVARRGVS